MQSYVLAFSTSVKMSHLAKVTGFLQWWAYKDELRTCQLRHLLNKHCFGMCRKLWITNHANAIRALVFLQLQVTCVLGIVCMKAKWFQLSLCHVKVTLKPCHMPSSLFFVLFYCFTLFPDLLEKNTITIFIYLLYIHIYYSVLIIQIKVRWPKHCIKYCLFLQAVVLSANFFFTVFFYTFF